LRNGSGWRGKRRGQRGGGGGRSGLGLWLRLLPLDFIQFSTQDTQVLAQLTQLLHQFGGSLRLSRATPCKGSYGDARHRERAQ
jgi:hypothetical protein